MCKIFPKSEMVPSNFAKKWLSQYGLTLDPDSGELRQFGSMQIWILNQNTSFLNPYFFLRHQGHWYQHQYSGIGQFSPIPEDSGTGLVQKINFKKKIIICLTAKPDQNPDPH